MAATLGGYLASHSCCRPRLQVKAASSEDEEFEARLAKIRRRSGKKAASTSTAASRGGKKNEPVRVLLPPVPLIDPVSDGLTVELGFNPYSERMNGRFAGLGLAAFLLVELATGSSFIKFHEPAIIGVQAYTVLALAALFIKFEKEKKSIWPSSSSSNSNTGNNSNV